MSDLIVRVKCKHGRYELHPFEPMAGSNICPGGRKIVLRAHEGYGGVVLYVVVDE